MSLPRDEEAEALRRATEELKKITEAMMRAIREQNGGLDSNGRNDNDRDGGKGGDDEGGEWHIGQHGSKRSDGKRGDGKRDDVEHGGRQQNGGKREEGEQDNKEQKERQGRKGKKKKRKIEGGRDRDNKEDRVSLFADDSATFIASRRMIRIVREIIAEYERATGQKLHDGKTKILRVGKNSTREMTNEEIGVDFEIMKAGDVERYLGDMVGNEVTD